MLGYMEVILGPMLASQPCLHAFWVLTSLHLLSFLLKMFFYYSCNICNYVSMYVCMSVFLYDAPLAQRASYLALHSPLFGPVIVSSLTALTLS